jgi:hypothetical protein
MTRRALVLVLVLSVASTAASCPRPRHTTVVSLQALATSLGAVQDSERILWGSGKVAPEQHRAFGVAMAKVWIALNDAVTIVEAWQPGQPVPPQLRALVVSIRALMSDVAYAGKLDPTKTLAVYDAITAIFLIVNGGG